MLYSKCNAQKDRQYKNMAKSVILVRKKCIKKMIKELNKRTDLSVNVKNYMLSDYNTMLSKLISATKN